MAPTLASTLRTRHVAMISIGGVIGAGFFVGSSGAIALAGPGVMLTYLFAGAMVLLVNLMLRDIAQAAPGYGSFIGQIRHTLGPRFGFAAGWAYLVIWATTLAIEVMGAATLIAPHVALPYVVLEALVLGGMTAVNLMSVRAYGEVEYVLSLLKVIAIVAFIAIGVWALASGLRPSAYGTLDDGWLPHGPLALLAAVPIVVFSMAGTEVATIAALESDRPDENIVRVARSVALRLGVFYLAAIAVVLALVSWRDMRPGVSPFLLVLERLHIPGAAGAMTLVILGAVLSTLNSGLYAASRLLHDMARHGDAPGILLPVSARTRLPQRAVMVCSAAAALIALTAVVSPHLVFAFLVSVIGSFIIFDYVLIVIARQLLCRHARWQGWTALLLLAVVLGAMLPDPATRAELALSGVAIGAVGVAARLRHRDTASHAD